jgi:NADH-quinone oxidoreductase subunit N
MFPTRPQITAFTDGLNTDLLLFIPELAVCGGIVLLLLSRLVKGLGRLHLGGGAVAALVVALFVSAYQFADDAGWLGPAGPGQPAPLPFFGGMLIADHFARFVRAVILAASLVTVLLTQLSGIPDRDDSGDFYVLLLGGTLGMMLMASANHLLMVFIAVEMASLPSYALAGFLKGRRQGSEASLKYVVFGAGASGVMLYGISLLAGTFGTGDLSQVAYGLQLRLFSQNASFDPVMLTGFTMLLVGLGFKLAAFPFHFWCPDVFEGAAAEVAGFLSVASKAAAVALTLRIVLTIQEKFAGPGPFLVPGTLGLGIGVAAAVTVTFGNLAAFAQTNLKRLLAYSTIAHAGYMLLGVAVVTTQAASAVLYYLVAYLVMNLGAFAVVAMVRNATGRENLEAFRGLVWRSPVLAVTMALFLFSLLGFPPLAGFAGKFQVFAAIYDAGRSASAAGQAVLGTAFYALLGVGAVNTALSAYYYLKVVRMMVLEPLPESPGTAVPGPSPSASGYLTALAALLVALGVVWNPLTAATDKAAGTFTPVVRPS